MDTWVAVQMLTELLRDGSLQAEAPTTSEAVEALLTALDRAERALGDAYLSAEGHAQRVELQRALERWRELRAARPRNGHGGA